MDKSSSEKIPCYLHYSPASILLKISVLFLEKKINEKNTTLKNDLPVAERYKSMKVTALQSYKLVFCIGKR